MIILNMKIKLAKKHGSSLLEVAKKPLNCELL